MPVWTDTLEPITLDPREPLDDDDEEDEDNSQSEDEVVQTLPPSSKPAKPPSPEIIDVDALPSDGDDSEAEEEEEEEEEEDDPLYNQEEGGAYGIEDGVEYQDEAQDDSESGDQEDAITELEEECDVEGFREPPSSPISGPTAEDDVFASMLSSNGGARQESAANGAADSLAKFRAQRRREMQQLTEGFISR